MKNKNYNYHTAFRVFCCLFLLNFTGFYAQESDIKEKKFKLGSTFGDKQVVQFDVNKLGNIVVTANWTGETEPLALILNGPGQVGYYAREDSGSPISLNFEVTPELLAKGTEWTVSIVNFEEKGEAIGNIKIEYPKKLNRKDFTDLRQIREQPAVTERIPPDVENANPENSGKTQETGITRSILDDGTVELRYPDGRIKRITQGGYTIIHPDGTSTTLMMIQTPPTTPPELPSDERIGTYLEWQTGSLLDLIKKILNNNEESIDNFLKKESEIAQSVYQKMYVRTSYIERLLSN